MSSPRFDVKRKGSRSDIRRTGEMQTPRRSFHPTRRRGVRCNVLRPEKNNKMQRFFFSSNRAIFKARRREGGEDPPRGKMGSQLRLGGSLLTTARRLCGGWPGSFFLCSRSPEWQPRRTNSVLLLPENRGSRARQLGIRCRCRRTGKIVPGGARRGKRKGKCPW